MHRVIIIGTGGIGKRHIRGFLATGRANLTFVEPHAARAAEAVNAFGPEAAYHDIDEVDLSTFNLAVICTPAHLHVDMMRRCAEAGTPFLVEKPLAVTMDGVDAAIALIKEKKLLARVGYIRRIAPELNAVRDKILAGQIGEFKLTYVSGGQEFPKYRPDYRTTYYSRPEMGGGAILDAASHSFDMLIWLMGKPVSVMAMYDHMVLEGSPTEDMCFVSIRFESGAMANLVINQFQKPNIARTEFIGTKGNLMLEHSILSFADDDSGSWKDRTDFMDGLVPTEAHQARFTLQASEMLDAIEGKPDRLATLEDARTNLAIALAAKQSWLDKRIIELAD